LKEALGQWHMKKSVAYNIFNGRVTISNEIKPLAPLSAIT